MDEKKNSEGPASGRLDEVDIKILQKLQKDGTLSSAQIATAIGMSQSPAWRRVSGIEASGAIKGKVAILNRQVVGLNLMVYILIRLKDQRQETIDQFEAKVMAIPEIMHCCMMMGDIDFILLAVAKDLDAYNKLVRERISKIPGVSGVDSRVVVEELKNTTELPLEDLKPKG